MDTVIKGTNTVEEFNKMRSWMEWRANDCYQNHKQAFEDWNKGEIEKVWLDGEKNLCIEYSNGEWFHYNADGEWW